MEIDNHLLHICIPSFKEDNIIPTLQSLLNCDSNGLDVQISILINQSENSSNEVTLVNKQTILDIKSILKEHCDLKISYAYEIFKAKHAGVGLARKTLMDKVAETFLLNNQNGLIVALDADTIVETNYLQEISAFFDNSKMKAASIFYEHPLNCKEIVDYEFHLRYYNSMQFHSDFPFAIHTVGSAMVCAAETYKKKGGMNKRKAGEDFYFMQKFIKDEVCGNIINSTVIPSSRTSDRVPFGTGRAILKYEDQEYIPSTYNPLSFSILKDFNHAISTSYDTKHLNPINNDALNTFLESIDFKKNYEICYKNTRDKKSFLKRFYQYFDAFTLMKCLHFMRAYYPDVKLPEAAKYYSEEFLNTSYLSVKDTLLALRIEERNRFS